MRENNLMAEADLPDTNLANTKIVMNHQGEGTIVTELIAADTNLADGYSQHISIANDREQ